MQNASLEQRVEGLNEEKKGLESAFMRSKDASLGVEKELRKLKIDLEEAQQSISLMQSEHKMLSDDLTQKNNELIECEKK